MARYKFKTINTSTIEGIKQAEKLKADGWEIISVGIYTIQFQKQVKS